MTVLKPSPRYMNRLWIVFSIRAFTILVLGILSAGMISLATSYVQYATTLLKVVVLADLIWYLSAVGSIRALYESRLYRFGDDEIVIQSGFLTKSIRHIPLSNVIAFEAHWDWIDHWLEIGSLDVQTATGWCGQGSHVRLVGLADVEMVARMIARRLHRLQTRQFRDLEQPSSSPYRGELQLATSVGQEGGVKERI